MQIIRRTFLIEVELAVDVIHVMHHQVHRQLTVAPFDGVDQLGVLVVGAMRAVAAFVLGDDQRGSARTRLRWKLISGAFFAASAQFRWNSPDRPDTGAAIATGEAVALVVDHLAQFGDLLGGGDLPGGGMCALWLRDGKCS